MEKTALQIQTKSLYTCTNIHMHSRATAYSASKLIWGTEEGISDLQLFFLHDIKTHCFTQILTQAFLENQGHKNKNTNI